MNLVSAILNHARTRPDAPALAEIDREIDYRGLALAVKRTASYLTAIGIAHGDRVGLRLKNTADHVILVLAIGFIGAAGVPLDWRARPEELERIRGALGLKYAVAEPDTWLPHDIHAILLDGSWRHNVAQAEPLSQTLASWHDIFAISATSGSTGLPKFVAVTHLQFFFRARGFLELLGLSGRHRFLCTLPLGFGAWPRSVAHLLRGDCVIVYPSLFSAAEYVEVARRLRATIGGVVPTTVRQLISIAAGPPLLPEMAAFLTGGAPLSADEKRQALRLLTPNFYEQFGTTEFGTLTVLRPTDFAAHALSVGQPHTLVEIEIVDADDRPLPAGSAGRLRYRGPGLGSPVTPIDEPVAPHGFRGGWHYSDDIACLDDRSFLYLQGRSSDVINRGGAKFYPIEIENTLHAHYGVAEAAVIGHCLKGSDDEVVAFVVPRGEGEAGRLIAHCRAHLAAYKIPHRIRFVAQFPRTALGKVDKAALAKVLELDP
jgi:acyl-CoA synthetase (AMP-forming)/AMP-acid ligase II